MTSYLAALIKVNQLNLQQIYFSFSFIMEISSLKRFVNHLEQSVHVELWHLSRTVC